ncbi:MAG TPA: S1C family serine protease [Candidatus Paceibacterota bacterium]
MDDLNKNQIVLLTLLISFVTSIATGIMTTSLLQQAPVEVTRNINRIVEKTIETVIPATPSTPEKQITTVVVKEEDQIIDSINKNIKSVVRIRVKNPFTDESSFYGMGIFISKDGLLATDRKVVTSSYIYTGTMSDGTQIVLSPLAVDKEANFILFKATPPGKLSAKELSSYVFSSASLATGDAKLGQSLVSLGGQTENAVAVGRVLSLGMKESTVGSTTVKYLSSIETDLSTKDLVTGSPVFNLSGDVVGMRLSSDSSRVFTPIDILKKELPTISDSTRN